PTTMEYYFTTVAQLDEFGAYSVVGSAVQTLQFQFVKEKGEWRIDQAPPGIVLPVSTFLTIFSKHALYFYDLSLSYLVPDERWFPGGTTANRIVTALLAGPPEWLKGSVISQFPDGTQLSPGTTVTVDSTVAQVDLTAEAAGADSGQRQLMQLQLTESLASVPGIASAEISVADSILSIRPMGADAPVAQRTLDSRPVVLTEGGFGYLAGGELTPIPQLSDKIVALNPRAVALGVDAHMAAVLTESGVFAVRVNQKQPQAIDSRAGLIAPALDDFGFVWSVPAGSPNSIIAVGADGVVHPVAVTLPTGSSIVSLTIAQDNVRVAMLVNTSAGARLIVSAIARDAAQGFIPLSIGTPVMDSTIDGAAAALGAVWLDRFSVATLTGSDGVSSVSVFEVGGQRSSLGKPTGGVALVGGNGSKGLRILDSDHHLQSPRGSGWQVTTSSMSIDLLAAQR
ncbi:MAG: LpqB family beta-propeller domain-containing protein, partial [Terrimesophilobacter sp.]